MTGPFTFAQGRRGLWFLALAPFFLLASMFMGSGFSSSGDSSAAMVFDEASDDWQASNDRVEVSESLAWSELPGFGPRAFPQPEDERIPPPGEGEALTSTPLSGGAVRYEIDFATGARYVAELRPDGSSSYRYSGPPPELGTRVLRSFFLAVGLAFAGLGLFSLLLVFTNDDLEAKRLAGGVNVAPLGQHLVERWLGRSRWYRFVGGSVGVVMGFVGGDMNLSFYLAVAGMALGGALSELHLLRRRKGSSSIARLSVRRMTDYTEQRDLYAMGVVAVGSLMAGVLTFANVLEDARRPFALAALLVVAATLWFQHRVVSRSRPAIRRELNTADDLLRYLAATQGFARPAVALGFFLLAYALNDETASAWFGRAKTVSVILGLIWLFVGRHSRIPRMAERVAIS